MFSKSCEYAIKASIFVAKKSLQNEKVSFIDIAKEIDSPEAFTAKILQKLTKHKIIHSIRGVQGGFYIPKDLLCTIQLVSIVKIIDGENIYKGCSLGLKECNAHHPCPLHDQFVAIRNDIASLLENTNLYDLAQGLHSGYSFLKRT